HSTSWTLRAALGEIGRTSGGGDIEVTAVGRRSFRRDFGSRQSRGSPQLRQQSNWGSDTAPIACSRGGRGPPGRHDRPDASARGAARERDQRRERNGARGRTACRPSFKGAL